MGNMPTDLPESTPRLARLQACMESRYRLTRELVPRAVETFGPAWAEDFEAVLADLFPDDPSLEAALRGYVAFALDSMRRQKSFERSREYPKKSYAEAAVEVYLNEAHMLGEYLPGLLLSHFLWPHHYRQLQFFEAAFLAPMKLARYCRFAEVGIGTAVYSRRILASVADSTGSGFDISTSSCAFARRHLEASGSGHRFRINLRDVIANPIDPIAWLVCVEVLEHLEDPVQFLVALRRGLATGGRAFITAALNAAHADHIYLYRTAEDVWAHLESAGFRLEQSFVAAAYAPPAPGVPVPLLAAFVVY